ncbi:tRNA-dihydrouridine(20/20a) synthase-like [Hordeum vulgare subsp. vulgare]|uniref:tRNA-dihydrouridine(20/20a) synthase-like n=1 Tax=Hordeum vulgare subsp. vulgare TaxID=112509 RepID=UPI001D1A5613|nr:tRNA-dihydrouridine(20/20a) synthase-like [Hordeum vulgare subsp. vulgare]
MRSAAWHALLPSLVPANPGIFFLRSQPGRFLSHAHGLRPCRAASSLPPGEYLPPLFSVAPMMDWTDNHYRTLARLISRHAWLYTEMVVAETIVHQKDKLDRFLAFPAEQHPIVLQLGGSNLDNLAKATELASGYSYDEINLNCGCPSGKVAGHGCFGARLMYDPEGMLCQLLLPIVMSLSVLNAELELTIVTPTKNFVRLLQSTFVDKVVSKSPTRHFIIHARKALLSGLSPAENRTVPPLKYEYYYALLRDFPEVSASIRQGAHRVMVGRAAYNNPWNMLGHVDSEIYGMATSCSSRRQILESYQVYGDSIIGQYGISRPNVRQLVKPLLHLFHSEPGNSLWKRRADSTLRHCKTLAQFLEETLDAIPDSVLDAPVLREPSREQDYFAHVDSLLPPRYATLANGSYESPALVTASS